MATGDGSQPGTLAPVTGSFTGVGSSASFMPVAGRGFNIHVSGAFVGTVILERRINGQWVQKWPDGVYQMSAPRSFIDGEPEHGVQYRLRCTAFTSGPIDYSISQ